METVFAKDRDEWRRWLAQQLDTQTYLDTGVESPVRFTHLAGARWRAFDAVLLLGCDAAHLPRASDGGRWFNDAVRGSLGLPTRAMEAARQRDFVAQCIVDLAGRELAELAVALVEQLGWKKREFTVVCAGGIFASSARIRGTFAWSVRAIARRARVALLRRAPVEGALALARRAAE